MIEYERSFNCSSCLSSDNVLILKQSTIKEIFSIRRLNGTETNVKYPNRKEIPEIWFIFPSGNDLTYEIEYDELLSFVMSKVKVYKSIKAQQQQAKAY